MEIVATFGDHVGYSVNLAGDFNGDGIDDLVSSSLYSTWSVVVFGSDEAFPARIFTSTLDGTNGFRFSGRAFDARSVGDVNGDGLDDLGILTVGAAVRACVLFGQPSPVSAALNCPGPSGDGFISLRATRIAALGDVNHDDVDDFLLAAPDDFTSEAYVIYGVADPAPWHDWPADPSELDGTNGFLIQELPLAPPSPYLGFSAAGKFDVNGDGIEDFMVSVPNAIRIDTDGDGFASTTALDWLKI